MMEDCRARFGKRFTIKLLGTPPFVLLCDPDEIKQVFTASPDVLHPGEGARILQPVVGRNSLILLDEDAHLSQRRLMLPAFHGEQIARLVDVMAQVAGDEVERWPRNEPIALHPRLQALTLEIILRTVFGLDEGARLDRLRSLLTDVLAIGANPASMLPLLQRDLGPRTPWGRFVRIRDQVDAELHALVDERRADGAQREDVLALLLAARHEDGSPMSAEELRDELMTLLVAGHETTASELAFAFERLVRTPAVLDRLTSDLGDDAYVTATVQEVLRRRPVLPLSAPRLVVTPIEVGGVRYEPGVCLAPCAYLVHHDPSIYPEPYEFRPERFLEESPGTYTWIPFGGGRRRCLGAAFATAEMKVVLRAVLERARPRAAGDGRYEISRRRSITLSPREGAEVVLVP
jgi:cytochrome P450